MNSSDIEHKLFEDVAKFLAKSDITALQSSIRSKGVAVLYGLFSSDTVDNLKKECHTLLDKHGVERDFLMKQTSDTPRRMRNVKQADIFRHGHLISSIYSSPSVRRLFEIVIQDSLLTCPYTPEEYIINALFHPGGTHGWHWDDYKYGVVFAVEVPAKDCGGLVQVVPNTVWDKDEPSVEDALVSGPTHSFRLAPGDAYILRTDTGMHRVSPIKEGTRRIVVNMVWATPDECEKVVSHETMEALFS